MHESNNSHKSFDAVLDNMLVPFAGMFRSLPHYQTHLLTGTLPPKKQCQTAFKQSSSTTTVHESNNSHNLFVFVLEDTDWPLAGMHVHFLVRKLALDTNASVLLPCELHNIDVSQWKTL